MIEPIQNPLQTAESAAEEIGPELRRALLHLAAASRHADRLGLDRWEFAVESERLLAGGITISDVRWLLASGYAIAAQETTRPDDSVRRFRSHQNLALGDKTCLVLSQAGGQLAQALSRQARDFLPRVLNVQEDNDAAGQQPHWDPALRVLRLGGTVIKRLNRAAPNQEAILSAFQEEGWPARIDDPIPPKDDLVAKCRLRDAIRWLNRNLEPRLLRFYGDGSGEGICWELLASAVHDFSLAAASKLRAAA
jgi:hypothetical protein